MKSKTRILMALPLALITLLSGIAGAETRFTIGPRGGVVVFDSRIMKDRYDKSMNMVGGEIGMLLADRTRLGMVVLRGETDRTITSSSLTTQRNTHESTIVNMEGMFRLGDPETFPVMPYINIGMGACYTEDLRGPVFSATGTPLVPGHIEYHTRFAGQLGFGIDVKPVHQLSLMVGATYLFVPVEVTRQAIPFVQNATDTKKLENLAGTFIYFAVMANVP